jgi:hypothetical protein
MQGLAIGANLDISAFFELLQWNQGYALKEAHKRPPARNLVVERGRLAFAMPEREVSNSWARAAWLAPMMGKTDRVNCLVYASDSGS